MWGVESLLPTAINYQLFPVDCRCSCRGQLNQGDKDPIPTSVGCVQRPAANAAAAAVACLWVESNLKHETLGYCCRAVCCKYKFCAQQLPLSRILQQQATSCRGDDLIDMDARRDCSAAAAVICCCLV